jgi:type II secretory pathway predicted ATPase ExeA
MLTEVMEHFGLSRDFSTAGYYETEHHRLLAREVKAACLAGRLVAVTGVVGSGKTMTLRRIQGELHAEGKVAVAKSLSIDKDRITLPTLITALFYDLSSEKDPAIPTQGERRERALQQLVRRGKKPVALFIDEAHDLHGKTLIGLKRLMEVVADGGGMLSVVLVGHPKLKNDLRRPTLEEIGYRTVLFDFDILASQKLDFLRWLLATCVAADGRRGDIIDEDALELLQSRLKTPLQLVQYLTSALEEAYRIGERPATRALVESVLSRHIDDIEPRLTRHGYNVRVLAEQFSAKPAEIRQLLRGELNATRAQELTQRMIAAGLPL